MDGKVNCLDSSSPEHIHRSLLALWHDTGVPALAEIQQERQYDDDTTGAGIMAAPHNTAPL